MKIIPNELATTRKGKVLAGVALGFLSWLLVVLFYWGNFLESYEMKTYDQLCRFFAQKSPAPAEIALITVDRGSLEAAQKEGINWPWPRQMYAPIVQFCAISGARAVAFDIVFTEPSSYGAEDDRVLADALSQNGRTFLPVFLSRQPAPGRPGEDPLLKRISLPLRNSPPAPTHYNSAIPPIAVLAEKVLGLGNVAIPPDADGIYRRLPLVFPYRGLWVGSLGMAVYQAVSEPRVWDLEENGLHSPGRHIPLNGEKNFLLTYYDPDRDFPRFSAFNVIQSFQALQEKGKPIYAPEVFRDKIVFVGFTAPGLFDLKPTPVNPVNPGMAIHATSTANLLHGDFRVHAPTHAVLGLALGTALAAGLTVMLVPTVWLAVLILAACGGALVGLILLAFGQGVWVDTIFPALSLAASFSASTVFSYATEGRQRRQIKQAFSHYMSDVLIQDLLRHPEKLRLGGEKRVLTVLFSDLAGFTALSERLKPEQVVHLLNRYLTAMTDIILAGGGLIDKYEGDAIMAFWGAPLPQDDHALRACLAALDNQARLEKLRREFQEEGLPPVRARIGINTGEMIIGNMGSSRRFDFTVIGDSVNLASRLEGAGKEYGVGIIVSEDTCRGAADRVEVRELDLLRVKGKENPVRIYELLARKGELAPREEKVREMFSRGLAHYRSGEWVEAICIFQEALKINPEDGPSRVFLRRCETFLQNPPDASWEGVYSLTTK